MTLEFLQNVQAQLKTQLTQILATPQEKPVMQHCNAIEMMGALQLVGQLIQQEQIMSQAPPGAMGPEL